MTNNDWLLTGILAIQLVGMLVGTHCLDRIATVLEKEFNSHGKDNRRP